MRTDLRKFGQMNGAGGKDISTSSVVRERVTPSANMWLTAVMQRQTARWELRAVWQRKDTP